MAKIRYTDEDLRLYAKVFVLKHLARLCLAWLVGAMALFATFHSVGLAIIGTVLFACMSLPLLMRAAYKRMRHVWHTQAPDGKITLRLNPARWAIYTKTIENKYKWSEFRGRYELLGCYIVKLSNGTVFVYRKDYFAADEQWQIEKSIPRSIFVLL